MTVTVTVAGDRGWRHLQRTFSFIHPFSFLLRLAIRTAFLERRRSSKLEYLLHSSNSASNIETSAIRRPWRGTSYSGSSVSLLWLRFLESLFIRCDACMFSKLNYTFLWQYSELKHPLSAKSTQSEVSREVVRV